MYNGAEFWWDPRDGKMIAKDSRPGSISSKDGGVLASNVMLLAAYTHLKEIWLQKRQSGVPWLVCVVICCEFKVCA